MQHILLHFANKYNGDWDKIFKALEDKEPIPAEELRKTELRALKLEENGYKWVSLLDGNYPQKLKAAYKPPFIIYYKGDLELLNKNSNTMVSTTSNVTHEESVKWANNLSTKSTIVLSNELKNDEALIKSLEGKDRVVVLNGDIEDYQNNTNELAISETPYKRNKSDINNSNRIAASISDKLVLISSKKEIHSKLTSSFLSLGKDIEAFMRDASTQDYNNELIKQGATPITSIKAHLTQANSLSDIKKQVKHKNNEKVKKDFKQKLN